MDGEWRIKDLYVMEEELEAQGVSTETAAGIISYMPKTRALTFPIQRLT